MTTKDKAEFTTRCLMSLVTDLADARENFQRIEAQIAALAKDYGVGVPASEVAS